MPARARVGKFERRPRDTLVEVHGLLCVLVYHPRDTKRGCDFEQIWHQAFVETSETLILDCLVGHIPNACVSCWMHAGTLGLKSGAQNVERIDDRGTEGT